MIDTRHIDRFSRVEAWWLSDRGRQRKRAWQQQLYDHRFTSVSAKWSYLYADCNAHDCLLVVVRQSINWL